MLRYLFNNFSSSIYSYNKYQVEQINNCCHMTEGEAGTIVVKWVIEYFQLCTLSYQIHNGIKK